MSVVKTLLSLAVIIATLAILEIVTGRNVSASALPLAVGITALERAYRGALSQSHSQTERGEA